MKTRTVKVVITEETFAMLEVLAKSDAVSEKNGVAGVLAWLAWSAADGVRRPGAWERSWVEQAFGGRWREFVERDPDCEWHVRPRKGSP